jgi:hypothetical protein
MRSAADNAPDFVAAAIPLRLLLARYAPDSDTAAIPLRLLLAHSIGQRWEIMRKFMISNLNTRALLL